MRIRAPRVDLQDFGQVEYRFVKLIARPDQHREVEVGLGIVWIDRNGPPEFADGVVGSPYRQEQVASIEAHPIVVGAESNRFSEMTRGVVQSSLALEDASQVGVRFRIRRLDSERVFKLVVGMGTTPGLKVV